MHRTSARFWDCFNSLPEQVQEIARKNYQLLERNPRHPSLRFKKLGKLWSVRVGGNYRALAMEDGTGYIWVWIGSHEEYERLIRD